MTAAERRKQILEELRNEQNPMSATQLAKQFGVSRQIIVGDIAILRTSGESITATPKGYLLARDETAGIVRRIACTHSADQMVEELNAIVDEGCTVLDVIIEHPIYNEIVGKLQLSSRRDVQDFYEKSLESEALPLSALTEGVHLHTILCPDEDSLNRVLDVLNKMGILIA